MKLLILSFFSLILGTGFSQKDRQKILANFDYITYYPDSTIRAAHKRQFTMDLLTVEFNVTGIPIAMGNTKKGGKVGEWIYSDGTHQLFPELSGAVETNVVFQPNDPADNRTESLRPRYEEEILKNKEEFQKKYEDLLQTKNQR